MIAFWWELFINDKQVAFRDKNCVNSISFSNPINGSDTATIKISDPDITFIDDNIYVDNAPVKIRYGVYETPFVKEFNGFISAIDIDFPESDVVTLTLTVMDKSHTMNRLKKKRSWSNTTSASVVQQIAREYGFNCEIEPGYSFKVEETISQNNETDIKFIEGLADNEDNKFYCKLIGDTIYYKKQGLLKDPVVSLTYRQFPYDLISFQPQITIEDKQVEASSSDINSNTLQTSSSTVDGYTASREVQGSNTPTTYGY